MFACFVSMDEPKIINEALLDDLWILSMEEELKHFFRNKVWSLVPRPEEVNIIGTKSIYKNKIDESWVFYETRPG